MVTILPYSALIMWRSAARVHASGPRRLIARIVSQNSGVVSTNGIGLFQPAPFPTARDPPPGIPASGPAPAARRRAAGGAGFAHLGGKDLPHRALAPGAPPPRFLLPRGVGEPAPRLDVGRHLRELVADGLLVRQRPAEGLALAHVGDGVLEGAVGPGERVQPRHQPLALEHAHDPVEPDALAAEQALPPHAHV